MKIQKYFILEYTNLSEMLNNLMQSGYESHSDFQQHKRGVGVEETIYCLIIKGYLPHYQSILFRKVKRIHDIMSGKA